MSLCQYSVRSEACCVECSYFLSFLVFISCAYLVLFHPELMLRNATEMLLSE
jgi:hypothetical protein